MGLKYSLLSKAISEYKMVTVLENYIFTDEYYIDLCCYHLQQIVEKVIKHRLEQKGIEYPFTNNINKLLTILGEEDFDSIVSVTDAQMLNNYEAKTRYSKSIIGSKREIDYFKNKAERLIQLTIDKEKYMEKETHLFD